MCKMIIGKYYGNISARLVVPIFTLQSVINKLKNFGIVDKLVSRMQTEGLTMGKKCSKSVP